ncbi:hypothetical protein PFISCL1PPCAC_12907 [Pristionchus fissidentatus]|uniref:Uncharacterized protein n=1 Tax=Pristionchus fissidentatus TaxID=1538716 RepID=A0AAV5VSQ5_9BILA|nr:hypothetical protein PFISCL1PPCAC_12907 [Pristionchus fissidentatus]
MQCIFRRLPSGKFKIITFQFHHNLDWLAHTVSTALYGFLHGQFHLQFTTSMDKFASNSFLASAPNRSRGGWCLHFLYRDRSFHIGHADGNNSQDEPHCVPGDSFRNHGDICLVQCVSYRGLLRASVSSNFISKHISTVQNSYLLGTVSISQWFRRTLDPLFHPFASSLGDGLRCNLECDQKDKRT